MDSAILRKCVLCLCFSLVLLACFISRVNPLVGVYYRYLIISTAVFYLVCSLALPLIITGLKKQKLPWAVGLLIVTLFVGGQQRQRNNPFEMYRDSLNLLSQHPYVKFARNLQKRIPKPDEVTLMFGDAGAIPYFFNCKFLDINGLTEPFLARSFREGEKRRVKVSDYVQGNNVDLAVLAVEGAGLNLQKDSQRLPHGPLSDPSEYRYFLERQKENGFVYVGTLHTDEYDLHFGANSHSPNFNNLKNVLEQYISEGNGYFIKSDLVVQFTGGDVTFKNSKG
jgi:hypothetical protein